MHWNDAEFPNGILRTRIKAQMINSGSWELHDSGSRLVVTNVYTIFPCFTNTFVLTNFVSVDAILVL